MMRTLLLLSFLLVLGLPDVAASQELTTGQHIAAAVTPLPPALRDSAGVYLARDNGTLETLREGQNAMRCIADDPGDDRFHVACYHASLEPFMARGRALRAEGHDRDAVQRIREEEANAGTLPMPERPAALYSYSGDADSFDPETGELTGARKLTVVYMPWATAEETGLPLGAPAGEPWIMEPGKPWAHIMLIEQ